MFALASASNRCRFLIFWVLLCFIECKSCRIDSFIQMQENTASKSKRTSGLIRKVACSSLKDPKIFQISVIPNRIFCCTNSIVIIYFWIVCCKKFILMKVSVVSLRNSQMFVSLTIHTK